MARKKRQPPNSPFTHTTSKPVEGRTVPTFFASQWIARPRAIHHKIQGVGLVQRLAGKLRMNTPKAMYFHLKAFSLVLLLSSAAKAEEIHVICPVALSAPMRALGEAFSAQSGAVVTFTFDKVQAIRAELEAGSRADLIVLPWPEIDALEASKVLLAGSRQPLGRVPLAVAVREDAVAPDVSTPTKLRDVLRAASAVAYTDPATGSGGGILAAGLLNKPEFSGVHGKPVTGPASAAVIHGDASIAIQPMSELV
jgi:molybdate transport system substrate-binding protein